MENLPSSRVDREQRVNNDQRERTRVRRSLRSGAKVTTLVSVSMLAVSVYFLFAPVFMQTSSGLFPCGTVVGSVDEFVANTCQGATNAHLAKAILSSSVALILGFGGVVLFGTDSVVESREMKPLMRARTPRSFGLNEVGAFSHRSRRSAGSSRRSVAAAPESERRDRPRRFVDKGRDDEQVRRPGQARAPWQDDDRW